MGAEGPGTSDLAAKAAIGAVRRPIACFTERSRTPCRRPTPQPSPSVDPLDRHNLLGLPAVAALKGDATHGDLFELLTVVTPPEPSPTGPTGPTGSLLMHCIRARSLHQGPIRNDTLLAVLNLRRCARS